MKRLIAEHGPCRIRRRDDHLAVLIRAIVGQQISSKAAASIYARLERAAATTLTPASITGLGFNGLREAGLSGVKARYVLNVAEAASDKAIGLDRITEADDEQVIATLTTIKGVGRWTAEMFLIFALNRPDVLPVGDLGVRVGIRDHFQLDEVPDPATCQELAEPWRPHRSVAIWYLWRDVEARNGRPTKPHDAT